MKQIVGLVLIVLFGVLLSGCPKNPSAVRHDAGPQATGSPPASTSEIGTEPAQTNSLPGPSADTGGAKARPIDQTRILFDFDSAEIKPEYAAIIAAHGAALSANGQLRVRLEGNTDERGSPEYNIGLGERRAQAVKRALLLQGVQERQITTISFGAERPVADGHSENAWAQNRRVEFVYVGSP